MVETVDEHGVTTGSSRVDRAHETPGVWHHAYSVVVVGPDGQALLQRRSGVKARFGGVWANTCCGHVRPGVPLLDQARTRVREELGLLLTAELVEVGIFRYEAHDPSTGLSTGLSTGPSGIVERELDHVLLARVPLTGDAPALHPDPAEVQDVAWIRLDDEPAWPQPLAPWTPAVLRIAREALATGR